MKALLLLFVLTTILSGFYVFGEVEHTKEIDTKSMINEIKNIN